MESPNPASQTYTTPTCSLKIGSKSTQLPQLAQMNKANAASFTLQLDRTDGGEEGRIILNGKTPQLDQLQQAVNQYVAKLVAKFPLPTVEDSIPEPAQPQQPIDIAETPVVNRLYPPQEQASQGSSMMKNLPGLRSGIPQATPAADNSDSGIPSSPLSTGNISKLLGRWNSGEKSTVNPQRQPPTDSKPSPLNHRQSESPYLIAGDRSLDHQLHLGNLAPNNATQVLTLSAIQLFDLATTLDEYAADNTITHSVVPTTEPSQIIEPGVSPAAIAPAAAAPQTSASPLSQLPNLTKLPTAQTSRVYDYGTSTSRSGLGSIVPWAAAAAIAVGAPLLLFGTNSNSLKELTSKVKIPNLNLKMPSLEEAKKIAASKLPKPEKERSDDETSNDKPTAALPKPWEPQPIQSPPVTTTNATVPSSIAPQTTDKIGIAMLPASLAPGTLPIQTTAPTPVATVPPGSIAKVPTGMSGTMAGIAPNPLSAAQSPTELNNIPGAGQIPTGSMAPLKPAKINNPVTSLPISPAKIATAPKVIKPNSGLIRPSTKVAQPKIGLPPASVTISKQPIAMPPDLSVANSGLVGSQPFPFIPPEVEVAQRVNPTPLTPVGQPPLAKAKVKVKAKAKVKPKLITVKPKAIKVVKRTVAVQAPQPTSVPEIAPDNNSGIANPGQMPGGVESVPPQNPPTIVEPPLQSNVGGNSANPFENPSLQETKRYFQSKWKADPTQFSTLQYVVQINGKNGLVRSVSPQSEADASYLKKTGLIKPGQKLLSPSATNNSDRRIRVLLQPDGNVDTLDEP